jgi:glycosyltransferase involved in cell wall biosynthesis
MLIIRLSGTKMVMTVHNLVPHDCKYPSLHRFMDRICGALMGRLIVHTQEAVDVVAETYGARAKIRQVNHVGYNKTQVNPVSIAELRESLGCDPSRKIFLSFGTVRPYKRIERIIAAAELFDRLGIDLVIAGKPSSGQYGSQIEELASSKTNVRLRLGFVPDQLLSVYLAAAEAVVFGHTGTLTSGAAHMALAYGKALLCSDTAAFREMIRLGLAFPCDFEDLESLKSAVEVILTLDKDRFAQACGAYQRRCGPESVGPQLRAVYEQLLPEEAPVEQGQRARSFSPGLGNLKSTQSRSVDCDLTNR